MPDDAAKQSKLQKFINEVKFAYQAMKSVTEKLANSAREQGKVKWTRMCFIKRVVFSWLIDPTQTTSPCSASP